MSDDADRDDLRARLRALDPAASLDPKSRPARELMETVMSTPLLDQAPAAESPRPRRTAWLAAAAAAVVVAGGAVALTSGDDAKPKSDPKSTLSLSLPRSDVMTSCVPFDVKFLKDMSPAFAGTVTEVTPTQVTIAVDRWYAGGNADVVTLAQPDGNSSAALDGTEYQKGKRYLVTAANGTVNGCGYSGPATPELEKSFDEAFSK